MMRRTSWTGVLVGAFIALSLVTCGRKDEKTATKPSPDPASASNQAGQPGPETDKTPVSGQPNPAPPPEPAVELPADPGGNQGKTRWARRLGSPLEDSARGLAIDDAGNVAVAGYYSDGAVLGSGDAVAAQKLDAYVAVYGPDGSHRWTAHFGGKGEDVGNAVAFDGQGNVVVVGLFADSMTIGDTVLGSAGSDDIFVAKFDSSGKPLWARKLGGGDSDAAYDVAVSATAIVITGSFKGSIQAADVTLKSQGNEDILVVALDLDGGLQWIKQFGYRNKDFGQRVTLDSRGNIFLLAEFSGQITFGGTTLDAVGNRDLAVAKLDDKGGHVWSRRFGSTFDELGLGLAVDPAGNLAITGSFDNEIDFGGSKLASNGESDIFVAKLDPAGNPLWARSYGSARIDLGTGIAMDSYGNVIVGGWFWQKVDFGGGMLEAPNGNKDAFLLKLSAKGEHLWSKRLGDRDHDQLRGIAVARDGRIAACGIFRFSLATGAETLESARKPDDKAPEPDAFVMVLDR